MVGNAIHQGNSNCNKPGTLSCKSNWTSRHSPIPKSSYCLGQQKGGRINKGETVTKVTAGKRNVQANLQQQDMTTN
jgi:hypothetical protein